MAFSQPNFAKLVFGQGHSVNISFDEFHQNLSRAVEITSINPLTPVRYVWLSVNRRPRKHRCSTNFVEKSYTKFLLNSTESFISWYKVADGRASSPHKPVLFWIRKEGPSRSHRLKSAAARPLRLWVRIPRGGGMDVCLLCVLCVVS